MNRRDFIKAIGAFTAAVGLPAFGSPSDMSVFVPYESVIKVNPDIFRLFDIIYCPRFKEVMGVCGITENSINVIRGVNRNLASGDEILIIGNANPFNRSWHMNKHTPAGVWGGVSHVGRADVAPMLQLEGDFDVVS